jgi:chromosome condensin MukBEF MukE localization factor
MVPCRRGWDLDQDKSQNNISESVRVSVAYLIRLGIVTGLKTAGDMSQLDLIYTDSETNY